MVNIIIPVFHSRETLPRALKSLENQTDRKFIVTIVVDGDGEKYEDITAATPLNTHLIYLDKNYGPGFARQYALDLTPEMFKWIMFLDSDDYLNPRAVEVLTYEAEHNNAEVVASSIIHEEVVGLSDIIPAQDSRIWVHGKIYSNKFLKENEIRFPSTDYNEDCLFNNLVFLKATRRFFVNEPLVIWKNNENSITRAANTKNRALKNIRGYAHNIIILFRKCHEGWLKPEDTIEKPDFILPWLAGLYFQYMNSYVVNSTITEDEEVNAYIKEFFSYPEVIDVLSRPVQLRKLKLHSFAVEKEQILFYHTSFDEFVYKFSGIKLDKNYNYEGEYNGTNYSS